MNELEKALKEMSDYYKSNNHKEYLKIIKEAETKKYVVKEVYENV